MEDDKNKKAEIEKFLSYVLEQMTLYRFERFFRARAFDWFWFGATLGFVFGAGVIVGIVTLLGV